MSDYFGDRDFLEVYEKEILIFFTRFPRPRFSKGMIHKGNFLGKKRILLFRGFLKALRPKPKYRKYS